MLIKLLVVLGGLLLMPLAYASSFEIKKVSEGIFYHLGVQQEETEKNSGAIANVGFIIGDNCVAVVDTGGSYIEGSWLRKAIQQKTNKPICYVINTHGHPDHFFGNAAFKDLKPVFIGHHNLPAAMRTRQAYYMKTYAERLGKAFKGTEFVFPTKTVMVGKPLTLELGHRQIVVTAYPTAHTNSDVMVYDKNSQTLWTGDLLFVNRIPVLDGSINGWIADINKIVQLKNIKTVIPGHGPIQRGNWIQAFNKEDDYFKKIRSQERLIIRNFGTIDDAVKTVGLDEKNKWLLFDKYHRRNVTAAFVELEWE